MKSDFYLSNFKYFSGISIIVLSCQDFTKLPLVFNPRPQSNIHEYPSLNFAVILPPSLEVTK